MKVQGSTVLVTGANQGIGRGFVEVVLERGAAKVYATARRSETLADLVALDPTRVVALPLDITDDLQRRAVFTAATDVNLLVNNAGIAGSETAAERRFLSASSLDDARSVMETDFWAHVEMCRGFAPHLMRNSSSPSGSAIINIISIGALFCVIEYSSYSAAKSALAMATIGLRAELAPSNVSVHGVFTGAVESRMSAKGNHAKATPAEHARQVLDAVEAGTEDIYAGLGAQAMYDEIRKDPEAFQRSRIERYRNNPVK
jgi:NAD(P)-dependent dehydrogenase (short-subunit alcohol dehydrogenase family)